MTYAYHSNIRLGLVSLMVNQLDKMTDFYTKTIGFSKSVKAFAFLFSKVFIHFFIYISPPMV